MDADAFRGLVERLAEPQATLDHNGLDEAYRCCAAIEEVLSARLRKLRRTHSDRPVALMYMNDGWSAPIAQKTMVTDGPPCGPS